MVQRWEILFGLASGLYGNWFIDISSIVDDYSLFILLLLTLIFSSYEATRGSVGFPRRLLFYTFTAIHIILLYLLHLPFNYYLLGASLFMFFQYTARGLSHSHVPTDNPRKSPPRAEIYSDEFKEGVGLCYEFAKELIKSAEILRDQGKHSPARALAIHTEEELGKAAMLLDEIAQQKPWITERRWNDTYRDQEHKARRAHLAVQKNVVKVTEWEPSIHAVGSEPYKKVVTEGDQMKQYAKDDIEKKFKSLYVDHGLIGGLRQWISPLDPNSFYSDSDIEISLAIHCLRAIEIEAGKQGITL